MLEHGGNLRDAAKRFGRDDWIDLSTGINPRWYPAPEVAGSAWHRLPEPDPALTAAAQAFYGAPQMLPVAGTQAAIQALPRLRAPSRVAVSAPSYAEHAHHWAGHGHAMTLTPYAELPDAVAQHDVVVVVNPNNPTGAVVPAVQLLQWADQLAARGGWLVVDEAFGDTAQENSVAAHTDRAGLIVLRSVGKFFGLAGIRLGFVAAHADLLRELANLLGPWTISGPAQQIAMAALSDHAWQAETRTQLAASGERLRALLAAHGIQSHGTPLFQWWAEPRPEAFWQHMAERGIWVRLFTQAARGIRLGLPPDEASWQRLHTALKEWTQQ
ncbi:MULTISPECIES: threonine-phosphate decarboxylase CobD [unclassified Duganella]|jgi:cobalamin biosynthetic protein CobC|uniref:threonine-phosphate decarboxylase CobD n=1 Tax=unclassified Duganella TaxID=2636909 RepID=UPI00088D5773|nr:MULTISPECIES: threonine-phosphate decarboxylase CobD [unclassified Duganella]SDH65015.1 L-threonine O-3-phosphate decarboxylase [Duganella sp. OV458]SDK74950.1 L-threonine O-3-phosphate decarboxylase [Duganella sp. OV510]